MTRIPQQKRSIDTRERVLKAAEELFAQEGFYTTNTKRIAARAGVAIGSLYSYYGDKKVLFLAVLEEYNRTISERIALVRPDAANLVDRQGGLEKLIKEIFRAHADSPGFYRQATLLRETDPDVRNMMEAQEKEQRTVAVKYLSAWGNRLRTKDLEAAAFVIFGAIESIAHSLAQAETAIASKRLIRELSDMILRYLFPK
jgi:AcrR family transcriptional regulator